jgi:formate hydrogenlyase transcriptional activator
MDQSVGRLKVLAALANQAARTGRSEGFDALLKFAFSELQAVIPCDRLAVGFLHEDSESLILGPVFSKKRILLNTGFRESIAGSALAQALRENRVRRTDDLETFALRYPQSVSATLLVKEGFRSGISVPLIVDEDAAGVLWIFSLRRAAYVRGDEPFVRLIAGQFAARLDRARLVGRLTVDRGTKSRLREENAELRGALIPRQELSALIGTSPPWRKMLQKLERVSASNATVLIRGETGTGKELLARAIHRLSPRKDKPFVAINCGALSPELIASELFGHERGAFTGATQRKLGRIELAHGGTLFLDEVAELRGDLQVKLLRVLQEREFERVGGTAAIKADILVIAATHRNLEKERAELRFRDDLFFRLNVFPIQVPPLRERKEDIEPLIEHFISRFAQKLNKAFEGLDPQALEQCLMYHWPGNVRELENLVERGMILSDGPMLYLDPLLEADHLSSIAPASLELDDVIAQHLAKVLKLTRGKIYGIDGAARMLGLKPSTLQAKMKKLGVGKGSRQEQ